MPEPPTEKSSVLFKIWSLLVPVERKNAIILLGLMFIGMLLEMLGVGLVVPVIVLLTKSDLTSSYPDLLPFLEKLGNPGPNELVIGGMLVLFGVYFIKNIFLGFLAWRLTKFSFDVGAQLSQNLFTVYLHQPYTFHLQRNSAQLLRNVINEVGVFRGAITAFMLLITETLVLLGLCVMLVSVEPVSTIVVVSVVGISAWAFYNFTRKQIKHWGKARNYHEGLRIQHLQQGLGGAKDAKLLGRETDFLEQYRLHNIQSTHVIKMVNTLKQLPRLWLELLSVGGLVAFVLSMLLQGRSIETVLPVLGLFAAATFRLMPSANRLLGAVQSVRFDLPVINVLYEELYLSTPTGNECSEVIPFYDSLELKGVSYSYPEASEIALKNISLTIHRGESIGFIGTSGAGKSTLVDILLGLLTPDSGEVRIDGKDIQTNIRKWQDQIGYVSQSIYLTDDTLCRNVAFGLPDDQIDETAVWNAICAAQLDDFVRTLPKGLETEVGERGVRLSGGQRQRIGIARALYHDPEVLVLDEATSSLDANTELGVMQSVEALHGKKTIIIVAHRVSTIESCDRLYKLEHGQIVADGAVDEILGFSYRNGT